MTEISDRTETLFAAAVELKPEERLAFLDKECAGDQQLRKQLEALLQAHDRGNHLLDRGLLEVDETVIPDSSAQVGTIVAERYKLLEQIGEGGMGTVWVAEQFEPVRRKVALKLIKAGMDSKSVLARFEAERQALALMDHPHIAKVLDGGLTESGRPYFVMEYVKGVPITEYCDAARLSVTERLDLFLQVCSAVQHAHQKGIIHRDLKPSNVLVAPYDDKPVPKVIDFGLAKAMNQSLTDRTLHTAHEMVLGTPLYMSPEQAQLNNLDVDTRTDIYALGVLLYELLTGTTPFEKESFKTAAWDEVRRIIREVDPPRPSLRLSSTQTLPSVAACRHTEPVKLTQLIRGDLDWIVMKALEKDRKRRYETANGLARDLERYLSDEVVDACPPTLGYRLRKVYRRNRAAVLTTLSFAAVLFVATGVSTWQAVRATKAQKLSERAQQQAEQAKKKATSEYEEKLAALQREADALQAAADKEALAKGLREANILQQRIWGFIFAESTLHQHPTGNPTIQEILDDASHRLNANTDFTVTERWRIRDIIGTIYSTLNQFKEAREEYRQAYEELQEEDGPYYSIGFAKFHYAKALVEGRASNEDLVEAEEILRKQCNSYFASGNVRSLSAKRCLQWLSSALLYQGKWEERENLARESLEIAQTQAGTIDETLIANYQLRLVAALWSSGDQQKLQQARELCQQAIEIYQKKYGPDSTAGQLNLAVLEAQEGRYPQAIERAEKVGKKSADIGVHDTLALFAVCSGNTELAGEQTQLLIEEGPLAYGDNHPNMRRIYWLRGWYYVLAEKYDAAEAELNKAFAPNFDYLHHSEANWDLIPLYGVKSLLGQCMLHKRDYDEAERCLSAAEQYWQQFPHRDGPPTQNHIDIRRPHLQRMIELYIAKEDSAKAAYYQEELNKLLKYDRRHPTPLRRP